MRQLAEEHRAAFVGAHVDPNIRAQLLELARAEDRSLASVIRRALDRELDRGHQDRALGKSTGEAGVPGPVAPANPDNHRR